MTEDQGNFLGLGNEFYLNFYPRIKNSLCLSEAVDEESRDVMSVLLSMKRNIPRFDKVKDLVNGKVVIVFGAGPSLEPDLEGLEKACNIPRILIVGADGATDLLLEKGVLPDLVVSDLDSCSEKTLKQCSEKAFIFVHAHGDNVELIQSIVPNLSKNLFGTTQVTPNTNVKNYGGFTDGDRACFISTYFLPSTVITAGMDFGNSEGRYSENRYYISGDPIRRGKKLRWGKRSLEFLIKNSPSIEFWNVTKYGEDIRGAPKLSYAKVISRFS